MMMLLSAIATLGTALPHAPAAITSDNPASGGHHDERGLKKELNVPVNEYGQPCLPNPILDRKVVTTNYEYGCKEIEVISLSLV